MSAAELMARYQVDSLVVDPARFRAHLQSLPGTLYDGDAQQRYFERVFVWGHDHDFGPFQMQGHMGDRHVRVIDKFAGLGVEFSGRALDVGCWTGGTSLLLAALGCNVTGIEEVAHYAQAAQYLADGFGLAGLCVQPRSLYHGLDDLGRFDLALCAGVLYHLSDPIVALRILFDALRDGGRLLVETAIDASGRAVLSYAGPQVSGWRWLVPSLSALRCMLEDVGFSIDRMETGSGRAACVAVRDGYVSMTRAGVNLYS